MLYEDCVFVNFMIDLNLSLSYFLMPLNFIFPLLCPSCSVWLIPLLFKGFLFSELFKLLFNMLET